MVRPCSSQTIIKDITSDWNADIWNDGAHNEYTAFTVVSVQLYSTFIKQWRFLGSNYRYTAIQLDGFLSQKPKCPGRDSNQQRWGAERLQVSDHNRSAKEAPGYDCKAVNEYTEQISVSSQSLKHVCNIGKYVLYC